MTEEIQDIFDEIRNIMQPDMDCTARYHALDALLLRALKDRTRHSPVDFTHTAARRIGSANKPAIRPTRWKCSVHGPDEYKKGFSCPTERMKPTT